MIKFKNHRDSELFASLHPLVIMIFADAFWFAKTKLGKELYITQTKTTIAEDYRLGRVSNSHRTGRAIDIGVRNLTKEEIDQLTSYVNKKKEYRKYKYQARSGAQRLAYYHHGTAPHIHLAIHARYSLPEYSELASND